MGIANSGKPSNDYSASANNPASSCKKIRDKTKQKRSGYYWVKRKCMPYAYRVYCDYDNYNPNFYLYFGNYADKKT